MATIAPATGSIFVEMKKNRESFQPRTGAIDNAYAAGRPSSSTSAVDTTTMMTECSKYGTPLDHALEKFSKVGLKTNVGGSVAASASVLKPVMNIHSTGKKNKRT